jgi:PEP-CTERM motif
MERLVRFAGLSLTIAVVVAVCSLGLAAQVSAISLTTSSPQFLGVITPDGGSPETEAAEINVLIDPTQVPLGSTDVLIDGQLYDRSTNSCGTCPDATAVGSVANETGNNTGDFGSGFTYLKAKYDAAQAGALVWYVAGLTGTFDVPSEFGTCGETGCGLSHWLLLNPGGNNVAEPSTTLLAGLAFAGIAFFSRKFLPRA